MTITRSRRIRQLQGKAANMKKQLTKTQHDKEHEAFKIVLQSRELKEDHRIALQQLPQLQHHHLVQKIIANGSRLLQLNHELAVLEMQQEVLLRQEEQLEAANKGVAAMDVDEDGWPYPGIPLEVEVEEIWEWISSMLDSRKSLLISYHKDFMECRYDRQDLWEFAVKVQRQLGERIVLPMTDLRS